MRELYPAIEPYAVHRFERDSGHQLYVEECGNPKGIPVVYLHGGPGSGCKLFHRSFFDPARYRVVLLDQRGSGRSEPLGGLENNTTAHLLQDLEFIRERLGIPRWLVYGGSWGAALGLLYGQAFPDAVSAMILRGTFLARKRDLDWYLRDGVSRIYPEQWAELLQVLPVQLHDDPVSAISSILHGPDELARLRVAKAWNAWGAQVALAEDFAPSEAEGRALTVQLQQARIELHYATHAYFIEDDQILQAAESLPDVPLIVIHGRRDLVCPLESAHALAQRVPRAELRILPTAGHLPAGEAMIDALVSATDELAGRLS